MTKRERTGSGSSNPTSGLSQAYPFPNKTCGRVPSSSVRRIFWEHLHVRVCPQGFTHTVEYHAARNTTEETPHVPCSRAFQEDEVKKGTCRTMGRADYPRCTINTANATNSDLNVCVQNIRIEEFPRERQDGGPPMPGRVERETYYSEFVPCTHIT